MRKLTILMTTVVALVASFVISNQLTAQQCCPCGQAIQYTPVQQVWQPAYVAPTYSAPIYSAPIYSQPVYSAPIVSAPVYSQPVYGQPVIQQPMVIEQQAYPSSALPMITIPQGFIESIPLNQGFIGQPIESVSSDMIMSAPLTASCKACDPVKGSKAHRVDTGHSHHPHGDTHTHHYEMHQSPVANGCKCFWHSTGVTDGDSPKPGSIPIRDAGGGGVEE